MYEASPLVLTPQKASLILNKLIAVESMFSDYQPACEDVCGYCEQCWRRKATIVGKLISPSALVYEVWSDIDLVGIMYIHAVVPKHDALAEFTFWDGDLRGKSTIINRVLERAAFGEPLQLHRVTTEVPEHMYRLGKFLERKLGFTHEGTRKEAMRWRGRWQDVRIYGRLASANGKG